MTYEVGFNNLEVKPTVRFWVGFVIGPGFLPRDYPTIAASLGIGMWRESLSRYKDQVAIALIAEQHYTRG